MGFQDDWIMRQITTLAHFVVKIVFNKDNIGYTNESSDMLSQTDQLHLQLHRLIKERKICQAEDLLYDNIQFTDKFVELATDFYTKLNELSDQELKDADFSRDEVFEGYVDILTKCGVPVEQFSEHE